MPDWLKMMAFGVLGVIVAKQIPVIKDYLV